VLELLSEAYTIADMAKELRIQPRTVKAHLGRLYLRFGIVDGCKNVKLAVRYYRMKHGTE
jgi:DNA-binding CsgD family transcriptional regulator